MPRPRTASAIAKSKLTPEQKAENRKHNSAKANRIYRLRKGKNLREKEQRRMMEKRSSMNEGDKEEAKLQRKGSDKKYYLKNRNKILDEARWTRINKWEAKWGGHPPGIYKCRNGTKRIGKEGMS